MANVYIGSPFLGAPIHDMYGTGLFSRTFRVKYNGNWASKPVDLYIETPVKHLFASGVSDANGFITFSNIKGEQIYMAIARDDLGIKRPAALDKVQGY